jgi:hypothetical protein
MSSIVNFSSGKVVVSCARSGFTPARWCAGSSGDINPVSVQDLIEERRIFLGKRLVPKCDGLFVSQVRQVELTAKGRALITRGFREHATAMEDVAGVLSKNERLTLLRLLKKLGKYAGRTSE